MTVAITLAAIHAESFPPGEAWTASAFADLLSLPNMRLFACDFGFLLLREAADEAEIVTLAVLPAARRHGFARALFAEAVATLREAGVARLFLEVAETNTAARALYALAGFREVGRRPRYYPDGGDALLLRREL